MFSSSSVIGAAATLMLFAAAGPALAQGAPVDAPAGGKWAFTIGAGTDNRSKDASKSGNDGYAFGSALWETGNGLFYAGPSFQTIQAGGSNVEAQVAVGYQPEAFGYQFDVNAAYKNRLDANAGYDEDFWEFTGSASRAIGPAKGRLLVQYTPDAAGSAKAYTWVEGQISMALARRWNGSVAVGRREQDNAPDYTGWNAGLTYAATKTLGLDLRYYDTTARDIDDQYDRALVGRVTYAF